jgi:glutamate---cysteine ligase / carboxylate-amine ligase
MKPNTALAQSSIISSATQSGAWRPPHNSDEIRNEIKFQSAGILTLGVEIELQLIDKENYNLSPRAEEILTACAHIKKVKPEFYLSTVEINTDKCSTVQQVEKDFTETFSAITEAADTLDIALSTTGVHPFAKYSDCVISETERYQELIDRNQWLTRRMTVYGLHIHLGMETGDNCIRFNNFFMYFMPHLLALSASSPFWQGVDTGLSSCRPTTYEALPTAGQPYHVRNWKDFENLYESLRKCGSIKTLKDLWWDIRPSPAFGTLEIRVCDGCATLYETLAIVAFVHTLAHWFADHGNWLESVNYPPSWLSRENKWRVIRYGLDAEIVLNTDGKTRLLREDVVEWLEKLKPYANKLGYNDYLMNLRNIMKKGNSSERQRLCFAKSKHLEDVVKLNIEELRHGMPRWDQIKQTV